MLVRAATMFMLLICAAKALATELIEFAPPAFLAGPDVSRAANGNTYSYRGTREFPALELHISVVDIPADLAEDDAKTCAQAFLAALGQPASGLYSERTDQTLQLGPLALALWRWTRPEAEELLTGVVACGVAGRRYVAVSYQDRLVNAPYSFPALRKSLAGVELR